MSAAPVNRTLLNSPILNPPVTDVDGGANDARRFAVHSLELWWIIFAASLIPVSLIWDYSWESSIGVDEVWSPPHLATRIGAWLCGTLGVLLVLRGTIAERRRGSAAGVSIGPLSAPSGAWVLCWGAALMEVAVSFDLWWQQAYGLGAGLWHPPQILKATAFFALLVGALMLAAVRANASAQAASVGLGWIGGLILALCGLMLVMSQLPNAQHTAWFARVTCAIYPGLLFAVGSATNRRWGMTGVALAYSLVSGAMVWILPLFPARPLTLPIHNEIERLLPPPFPLLLIGPAVALDWARARLDKLTWIVRITICGLLFAAVFLPVQWWFAGFLLSPGADNWFFAGGGRHWPFFLKIDDARTMFWGLKQDPLTLKSALLAGALAVGATALGERAGKFLRNLRR